MTPYILMGLGLLLLVGLGIQGRAVRNFLSTPLQEVDLGRAANYMRMIVSLVVLLAALYVLLFKEDDPQWATGAVGAIVGYWLPRD